MKAEIAAAFEQVSRGYSQDRVIADPELNRQFIEVCRSLGLTDSPVVLNTELMNLRKQGGTRRGRRSVRTTVANIEEYRFAAEIAARHLEQRHNATLDRVLCDPELAAEFDSIAAQLAPGHSSLEYRWAALGLRKTSRLKPEVLRILKNVTADFGPIEQLRIDQLPDEPGIYIFYSPKATLYVGEAENLRRRVGKHIDHSDRKALAHWLWEHGATDVRLETIVLPRDVGSLARKAVEKQLIASRRPIFNIQR